MGIYSRPPVGPDHESLVHPVGETRGRDLQVRAVGQSGQTVGSEEAESPHDVREVEPRDEVSGLMASSHTVSRHRI